MFQSAPDGELLRSEGRVLLQGKGLCRRAKPPAPGHPAPSCPSRCLEVLQCLVAPAQPHSTGTASGLPPRRALAALCGKALAPAALSQLRELISAQLLWTTCFPRRGAALPMPLGPHRAGVIGCLVPQRAEPLVQTHLLPLSSLGAGLGANTCSRGISGRDRPCWHLQRFHSLMQ